METLPGGRENHCVRMTLLRSSSAVLEVADKGENPGRGAEKVAGCINVTIHTCFCKVHDRDPGVQLCSEIQAIHLSPRVIIAGPRRLVRKVRL
jgi:hypothetical protein